MDPIAPSRLTRVISPLKRTLLRAARQADGLPDIPDAQVEVLRALQSRATLSPGELASRLQLKPSTISNLLGAMADAGLISRKPAERDRRSSDVRASPKAVELLQRFDEASDAILGQALALIDEDERAALAAALPALEHLQVALEHVSAAALVAGDEASA